MRPYLNLVLIGFGSLSAISSAAAQEDLLLQDTVVVEGSRSNPMLADVEPEVTLDIAEIRAYGAASLEELLADLEPLTEATGTGGAPAILLNGRRVSSFREIRNFPPEALARVEILPEEVALKFGFRADQKVINFILRNRFHALTADAELGFPTEGGQWLGELDLANLRIRDGRRWNFDFGYEYQDALFESDRDIISEDPGATADRTLQPEQHELELTGSFSHDLPGGVAATYLIGLDASTRSSDVAQSDLLDTLRRDTDEWGAEAGFVLNKAYESWNWTLNGNVSRNNVTRETEPDPINGFDQRTESETDTASLEAVVFTRLFALPAGDVVTTLKAGAGTRALDSFSDRRGVITESDLSRDETNAQINLDVPIFDRDMESVPFGILSLNANARVEDYSDAGTLSTIGYGLTWRPTGSLQIVASSSTAEDAPTISQLGAPISIVDNARVFDFTTGETVENVTRITGGFPDLLNEERRTNRVNVSWDPFGETDLTLNLTYTDIETDNAILGFPGLTPSIEAAFPDRVVRSDTGELESLDARPINISSRTQRRLRYGFNWTHTLPRPERPDLNREERTQLRNIFLERLDEEDRARVERRIAEREARRAAGQGGGAERRGGQNARRGGGGRGPGGRGGRGGGGGRLFVSVFHTIALEDSLQISPGEPSLDLLDGDSISDQGGSPEHRISAQAGYSRGALGAFVRVNWQSATEIDDGSGGRLNFDDLATANLRLRYDFGNNPRLLLRYPFLDSSRVSLNIRNIFDEKRRVTDELGTVPITYQPDLLDPRGRTITISFRKLFY